MILKKLLAIQNIQIAKKFNGDHPIWLGCDEEYIYILKKHFGNKIDFNKKGREILISHSGGYWNSTSPIIKLKVKLKETTYKAYDSFYDTYNKYDSKGMFVSKLLLAEDSAMYLDWEISKIKKFLEGATKDGNRKVREDRKKILKEFTDELNKVNISYKQFKKLKKIEDEVSYEDLAKLK